MNNDPLLKVPDVEGLLKWGKDNCCVIPDCITFKHEFGIGIHGVANVPITENKPEIKIHLPNDLIIDGRLTEDTFGERGTKWSKMLLAKLKFEKNPKNPKITELQKKFKPYIDSLPFVIDTPMVWNPEEFNLLAGTNLGSSIFKKFAYLYEEWSTFRDTTDFNTAMSLNPFEAQTNGPLSMPQELCGNNLNNDTAIVWGPIEESLMEYLKQNGIFANIYEQFTKLIYYPEEIEWDSFTAYFWAHLIYTSRAFPERIINPNCEESDVMLLPIVDLLNHGNRTKVEWSTDKTGSFCYTNLQNDIPEGAEIFNNYGAKSNEELLYGYGFTVEDNEFDTVLLVLKLDDQMFRREIYKKVPFKIPILEDYTSYAFETKNSEYDSITDKDGWRPISKYSEGIAYVINKINTLECVNQLLDIFSFISRRDSNASYESALSRLEGIQKLRVALFQKLTKIEDPWSFEQKRTFEEGYPILEERRINAENYKNGQIEVFNKALKLLKGIEKGLLADNKNKIITTAKIQKYDPEHNNIISKLLDCDNSQNVIETLDDVEIMATWLMACIHFDSFPSKYEWLSTEFKEYKKNHQPKEVSDTVVELYKILFNEGTDSDGRLKPFEENNKPVTMEELSVVFDFMCYTSFMRASLRDRTMTVMIMHDA